VSVLPLAPTHSNATFHGTLASSFTVVSDNRRASGRHHGPALGHDARGQRDIGWQLYRHDIGAATTAYDGGGLAESVNGTLSYLLSDPVLGSASVNLSGAVVATQLYAPYGAVRYASGILPTDFGFTHQRSDATSGLDDCGARWYDPLAGQFTSADTTLAGGLNRYASVAGNPETLVDPTGAYAQACDTSQCPGGGLNTYLPTGATGASESGDGDGVTTTEAPSTVMLPRFGGQFMRRQQPMVEQPIAVLTLTDGSLPRHLQVHRFP
jgi:RHS repeat-associated protein